MKRHNIVSLCCPKTTGNLNNPQLDIHPVKAHQLWYWNEYDLTLQLDPGLTNLLGKRCLLGLGSTKQGVKLSAGTHS